jgi:hypothetical protein
MKSIVTLSPLLSLVQLAIPAAGHIGAYGPGILGLSIFLPPEYADKTL